MSSESLESTAAPQLQRSRSGSPDYFASDGQETVSNPSQWWKNFVDVVHRSNTEFKITPESAPTAPDKCLEWAISVGSQILSSPDGDRRRRLLQYIVASPEGINYVLVALEDYLSTPNAVWLSYTLRECANPRNGNYRSNAIRKLVESDTHLDTIIRMLMNLQNMRATDTNQTNKNNFNLTTINLIWVLSAIAQRDNNFVTKVRTMSKVKFLHGLIKTHFFGKHHTHYPLLKIFRVLAKNHKVSIILGKDKVMKLLVKIFNTFNNQPSPKFLIVFEILSSLTKHKENCRRFLKDGLLINVMRAFTYWALWKGNGLLKLSKSVLSTYAHLSSTRAGKKALVQSDALLNIKKFCEQCPHERGFDDIVMKAASITHIAHRKDKVPVDDLMSPARFDVPVVKESTIKYDKDSGSSSDEDDPEDADEVDGESEDGEDLDDDESTFPNDDNENDNDDDDSIFDEDILDVSMQNGSSKHSSSVSKISKHGKGDAAEHIASDSHCLPTQPPEMLLERLACFAPFFKELDGKISEKTPVYDDLMVKTNSLVIESLLREIEGIRSNDSSSSISIPKAELKFFWINDHPDYGDLKSMTQLRSTYAEINKQVRSVIPFVKIAYPDFVMAYGAKRVEYINPVTDRTVLRNKLLLHITRAGQELYKTKVVYDLDSLLKGNEGKPPSRKNSVSGKTSSKSVPSVSSVPLPINKQPGNDDESMVGTFDGKKEINIAPPLKFESRFESGNLRKAIQVGEREYDLYLMSDVNSNRHNQWFYFQVSNTVENVAYTFNIHNCIKGNSQFNYGMQPVVFSVGDAMDGKPGWTRSGSNICYFKNGIRNLSGKKKKAYYTATFTLTFNRRGDIVYIAYHYPYTYTRLLTELTKMLKFAHEKNKVLVRYDVLCQTLNKNEVPLLTVTAPNNRSKPVELREIIFLSARVHPGESNSSWVMHGILHNLLFGKGQIENVLKRYVFKVIPMLNVEGVINGCHRTGLTNEDLNRRWRNPDPILHPSIYHSKALIEFSCKVRNKVPVLYCDLHGHSRRKNVFFYGCSRARSWCSGDRMKSEDPNTIHALPEALARRSPAFALASCNYEVRRTRESTARVALWREFGIARSYTLESSYCGCDRGPYKGLSLGIHHLIETGENLVDAVDEFNNPLVSSVSEYTLTSPQNLSDDPSKINFCNLEEPSWSDKVEAPSSSSSETDCGDTSDEVEEWSNEGRMYQSSMTSKLHSLNPIVS